MNKTRQLQKRDIIIDLGRYVGKPIIVKFQGGREVTGILRSHDPVANIVLDETVEIIREEIGDTIHEKTRTLGTIMGRGPTISMVSPLEGYEAIENPFLEH